jgi:hypothetical protein
MRLKMKKIIAFLNGIFEFKSSFTTHYEDYGLLISYEKGRDFAHVITFRKYEG